ncbi:type I polyketide synthase [Streptomyces sp. NPDC050732]|uniref:type I polyketide synthase n=1 Tax=Streptomyces sp. NPDC050732 TaxID=3154632 RepID=UPI003444CFED
MSDELADDAAAGFIAVVGMAGRFPGAADIGQFWENVVAGRTAMRDLSDDELRGAGVAEQWIGHPDYVKTAAVLDDADRFDAGLFDIAPREAALMDPQQRIFLETCWAALEHAGRLAPYAGQSTGVFGGAGGVLAGYLPEVLGTGGRFLDSTASLEHLGNDKDFLATRVSYKLGLTGPGLTVQTACSTSLVAVHLACQSLLLGECDTAVAGGVTVRVPELAGYLHQDQGILSPDGRCRPFDARARGTVFGSGAGAVVLRPLADALRDRDTVYAVIRGTAVNNDGGGKTSYGASTVDGQLAAMRQALTVAQLPPAALGYVEAHGTGTLLGDPLEVSAIRRALGDDAVCALGSVKALVGHLEAAAGIAGLIKTVLALHHGVVPPSPHVEELNPRLRLDGSGLYINSEPKEWPADVRRAAVNSLGIGGTNAFAVLEQAPDHTPAAPVLLPRELLTVSAKTADGLKAAAARWAQELSGRDLPGERDAEELADLAHTSQVGRRRLPHRVSVLASSTADAAEQLAAWLEGGADSTAVLGREAARPPKVAFLFSGQGAQYAGMGADLHERHSGFRASLARHADLFEELTGVDVEAALADRERSGALLKRAEVLQPAMFLLQVATAELWASWGVRPQAVAGHSLGEYAAACAAGVLTVEDGLRLVAERGAAIAEDAEPGGMIAVRCPDLAQLRELVRPYGRDLAVAGHNAPGRYTLSGTADALAAVRAACLERRWAVVELDVTHAFHSPLMAPAADRIRQAAQGITHRPPRTPLVTNLTGAVAAPDELGGDYWASQLASPVLFSEAVDTLLADGFTHFVEMGPGRSLTGFGSGRREPDTAWLAGLTSRGSDWDTLQRTLAELDADGVRVDWPAFHAPLLRRRVAAPTYPFARQRHWVGEDGSPAPRATAQTTTAAAVPAAPRTGADLTALRRMPLPQASQRRWESGVNHRDPAFLGDHVLLGRVVVPGAYHTACLLEAFGGQRPVLVEDLVFPRALAVDEEPTGLQIVLDETRGATADARVLGLRPGAAAHLDTSWTTHAQGRIRTAAGDADRRTPAPAERGEWTRTLSGDALYGQLHRLGYDLGPAFRWMRELRLRDGQAETDITVPEFLDPAARPAKTVLIDVCVQTAIGLNVLDTERLDGLLLPFRVEHAVFHPVDEVPRTARVRATVHARADFASDTPRALLDVRIDSADGRPLVELTGLELRLVPPHLVTGTDDPGTVHVQRWKALDSVRPGTGLPDHWLVLADRQGHWASAIAGLTQQGARCVVLTDVPDAGRPDTAPAGVTVRQVGDLADAGQLEAALSGIQPTGPYGVLHCAGLDLLAAEPDNALQRRALGSLPALVRALEKAGGTAPARLALITGGALHTGGPGPVLHPQQATLWGAGRSAVHELPDTDVRLVDVDPYDLRTCLRTALVDVLTGDAEQVSEAAVRDGKVRVPRLEQRRGTATGEFRARPDGTYLITGGLGALGIGTARWLADHGARHLVLTGRGAPAGPARQALAELERSGVRCTVVAADVSEQADVERLMARVRADGVPLRGVLHAAGVVEDALLTGLGWDAFARVLAPKVAGGWHLHRATLDEELDLFVLYSSTSGLLGAAGQAHYAAANTYLDALAQHRHDRGLPALSLGWGPVTEGMTARLDQRHRDRMAAAGFTLLDPRRVFAALGPLLAGGHDAVHGVFELDWDTQLSRFAPGRRPGNRPETATGRPEPASPGATPGAGLLRAWGSAGPEQRQALAAEYLAYVLAQRVGAEAAGGDRAASLTALGVDSMLALEIRSDIRADLGVDLPLGLLLQDEPVHRLETALREGLDRETADGPAAEQATAPREPGERLTPRAAGELLMSVHHLDDAGLEAVAALLDAQEQES